MVDASVVVKWVIPDPALEADLDEAAALLGEYRERRVELLAPPHWLAEVAAVVARLRPETMGLAIDLLVALEVPTVDDAAVFKRAAGMAHQLGHHLFDTLYHALAVEEGATLITADERYWRKAKELPGIVRLSGWHSGLEGALRK